MRNKMCKLTAALTAAALCALLLSGCGKGEEGSSTRVVFTTGFEKDEIFRIESMSCKIPEIMVYLTSTQNQYEKVYGSKIWSVDLNGVTLEENVKDRVLAKMAQVKSMNLLAKEHGVALDDEDKEAVEKAAEQYYSSLNEAEIEGMQVTRDVITQLYSEYALAEKVYYYIIKDINPEISDDEARTITVEQILIKTYSLSGSGERVPYTGEAKKEAYAKAQEALAKARAGEDFDALVTEYGEEEKSTYSFGKGETEEGFEKSAFNLGKDEISGIVETKDGYHIIKCLNTFNKEETDANKVKIVEQRKKEVFGQEYNDFVASLNKNLNENLWKQITFLKDSRIKTSDFFDIYNEQLGGRFSGQNHGL